MYQGGGNMLRLFIGKNRKAIPPLVMLVEQAKQEWKNAQDFFRLSPVDHEMIDYAIFMIHATEKRYMYLLRQAKQEGMHYSPYGGADPQGFFSPKQDGRCL